MLFKSLLNFNKILKIKNYQRNCTIVTNDIKDLYDKYLNKLKLENINEPELSINYLLAHVVGEKKLDDNLIKTITLNNDQLNKFNHLFDLRMINVPIQYIIGEWDFRNLTLKVKPPVFIPRPETEELIDLIINDNKLNHNNINFMDIGCGCGTISLSLLNELKGAKCLAIDKSQIACDLTKENAKSLNLEKQLKVINYNIKSFNKDLSNNVITDKYNLIVSNPPYIAFKKLKKLSDDIKLYEDIKAFDGGKDGLDIINIIFDIAVKHLNTNCFLWLEIDSDQTELIKETLLKSIYKRELQFINSFKDIFHNERFIKIVKL